MEFSKRLIKWYTENKRELPWRATRDPYRIWVSEIILQQTRVGQGLAYYQRFIKTFPDVKNLSGADEKDVLKAWQGLGYYSRARNMHAAARMIMQDHNGIFPDTYEDIIRMQGVGEYTASAIASFAFNQVYPVLDGNVYRVITRIYGIYAAMGTPGMKRKVLSVLNDLIDRTDPGSFNQAIMEFGALQCKPQNPSCPTCIFNHDCIAYLRKDVQKLPARPEKTQIKKRYFNYLVIITQDEEGKKNTFINKRTGNDIWKNLYDFPLIESKRHFSLQKLMNEERWHDIFGKTIIHKVDRSKIYRHKLTHREIICRFITVEFGGIFEINDPDMFKIPFDSIQNYPVSRLVERFVES